MPNERDPLELEMLSDEAHSSVTFAVQSPTGSQGRPEGTRDLRDALDDMQAEVDDEVIEPDYDEPDASDDDDEDEDDEVGEDFDPADYTVAQVLEYVNDNPELVNSILELESAGQNRSTLTSELERLAGDA